jgi:hypothetical protein
MSELTGRDSPAPSSERAPLAGRPEFAIGEVQRQQKYSASPETQAAFWVLLPIIVLVALLAVLGAQR